MHSDSIHETWLLRCNRPKKDLKSRTSLFGVPLLSTHTYSAITYYVKPCLSSPSETLSLLSTCQSTLNESPSEHLTSLRKRVLTMPDDAQWEIQKLIEARQKACSSNKVRRSWEVVGLMERNRRKLAPCDHDRKWWSIKRNQKVVEWVLVLKGETVDGEKRVLPEKHENAWKAQDEVKKVKLAPPAAPVATQAAAQVQVQVQRPVMPVPVQQQGTVLRHVENRRALSPEEAEVKMREIICDLFIRNEEEETDSEEESDEEEDGDESEIEDECQVDGKGRD